MTPDQPLSTIDVLVTAEFHASHPIDGVFRCHRARPGRTIEDILVEHGGAIRGIACAGHWHVDGAVLDRLPAVEIVANFGVGYDHIDAHAAAARGVVVTHTPDVLTEEVADLALGLTLATVRAIPQADRYLRDGRWLAGPFPLGNSLRGRKAGVVGLGRIGAAIARRLEAFAIPVSYWSRRPRAEAPWTYVPTLIELARSVDLLVVAVPGGATTVGLVDAAVLDALGPEGILVNIARGTVVDEAALIAALREGRILAAGLDVFEREPHVPDALAALDNTVLLPHVGSSTLTTRAAMGDLLIENLAAWFEGRVPPTPVPETPVARRIAGDQRGA